MPKAYGAEITRNSWCGSGSTVGGACGGTGLRRTAFTAEIMRLDAVLEFRSLATCLWGSMSN